MAIDTTTYLADAKIVYGTLEDQVSTLAAIINLFQAGNKMGKPINQVGIRGYQILARLTPNWNMGFRKEGVTGVGSAGNQGLKNSTVVLKYAYVPILITGQAENLTKGEPRAFMQAKALEAKFDMKDIVSHVNVIVAGCERGGELARVLASPAPGAGTFSADATGGLPGAIYLRKGQPIDTMAVGGGALSVNNSIITAINYSTAAVTHTAGTAVAGEAVALAGEYPASSADFPMTCEGLVSLISDTGAIQGLNPASAGEGAWASFVKTVSGALTGQLIQELRQYVKARGGEEVNMFLFPSAQVNQLVGIANTTIRFDVTTAAATSPGKKAVDLGFNVFEYGGLPIIEDKDLRPDRIYAMASDRFAKFEALPLSMAEDEAGAWTRVSGASGIADAVQGLLRWYIQFGTLQRSAAGVLKSLTIPGSFATLPPTL